MNAGIPAGPNAGATAGDWNRGHVLGGGDGARATKHRRLDSGRYPVCGLVASLLVVMAMHALTWIRVCVGAVATKTAEGVTLQGGAEPQSRDGSELSGDNRHEAKVQPAVVLSTPGSGVDIPPRTANRVGRVVSSWFDLDDGDDPAGFGVSDLCTRGEPAASSLPLVRSRVLSPFMLGVATQKGHLILRTCQWCPCYTLGRSRSWESYRGRCW